MDAFLIKSNDSFLNLWPIWLGYIVYIFLYFLVYEYDYSQNIAIIFVVILALFIALTWHLFQRSKREVVIKKDENTITVFETKFLGERVSKTLSIKDFTAVRSYISGSAETTINYVELVNIDGKNNLILNSFNPSSGDKFLSSHEYENKQATNLRNSVSEFTGLIDLGFLGTSYNRL